MNFLVLADSRHSCRQFNGNPIKKSELLFIKLAIQKAPSAGNLQAYEVFTVNNEEVKDKICQASYGQDFLYNASTFLVFFAKPSISSRKYGERGTLLYSIQDATIACTYAQLAATDIGVASVWIGAFDDRKICQALDVPMSTHDPIAILALGYSSNGNLTSPEKRDNVNTQYE